MAHGQLESYLSARSCLIISAHGTVCFDFAMKLRVNRTCAACYPVPAVFLKNSFPVQNACHSAPSENIDFIQH